MNRQKFLVGTIAFAFVCFLLVNPVFIAAESEVKTGTLTRSAEATQKNYWEDGQWIFYVTQCPSEEQVNITVQYSGDLNLDLVIFVDEVDGSNKVLAWDITHCAWDTTLYPMTGYSGIDTKDTALDGPETVVYINLMGETKAVYILVYVNSGVGISQYTLTCSNAVDEVPSASLQRCSTILQAWILFGIGCVIFSVIFLKIVKRSIMTPDQKAAEKLKKEEAQKQKEKKAKATGKAPSSMAARKTAR